MLRGFRVANHRSIRDEQELALVPAYDHSRLALNAAAIYGANAAGKSNLLHALRFMQRVVRDSYRRWEPGTGTPRSPFRLEAASSIEPSVFVVDLMLDDVRYVYGVALDDESITDEWLYRYPHGRRQIVFERDGETLKVGSTVTDYRSQQKILSRQTRGNASALGTAAMANFDPAMPVYAWFKDALKVRLDTRPLQLPSVDVSRLLASNKEDVVDLLRAADLGITDVRVDEVPYTAPGTDLQRETLDALRAAIEGSDDETRASLEREIEMRERRFAARPSVRHELRFLHGNSRVPLTVEEQSAGTMAWFGLIPWALTVLEQGGVLCIDEIDASLHPRLTARLVAMFKDPNVNPKMAQIIFTTHDASLLGTALDDGEVLARDEVWFVEKARNGATCLYALTDFHPRQGENRERRYLGGSYGAVPVVSDDDFRRPTHTRS